MESLLKEWFKKLPESTDLIKQITGAYKVHHPFIIEGYSDLLEDTDWGHY